MDNGRYTMTLDEVPAEIIAIRQVGVPCGLIQPRMEAGVLAHGWYGPSGERKG